MEDPALELRDVTHRYGRTAVLDGFSLAVPPGSVFGLIGPNGAGKTTAIKVLLGMLRPSAGEARVLGRDVLASPVEVKKLVGYVPESHSIYRWMRVGEVLRFARALYGSWNEDLCASLLERQEQGCAGGSATSPGSYAWRAASRGARC